MSLNLHVAENSNVANTYPKAIFFLWPSDQMPILVKRSTRLDFTSSVWTSLPLVGVLYDCFTPHPYRSEAGGQDIQQTYKPHRHFLTLCGLRWRNQFSIIFMARRLSEKPKLCTLKKMNYYMKVWKRDCLRRFYSFSLSQEFLRYMYTHLYLFLDFSQNWPFELKIVALWERNHVHGRGVFSMHA